MRVLRGIGVGGVLALGASGVWHARKPLPPGLDFRGPARALALDSVFFYHDLTAGRETASEPWIRQEIFDRVEAMIASAATFIVADFFLINAFAGEAAELPGQSVPLSDRLVDALVAARHRNPELTVIVITDPLNTLYGAVSQPLFTRLEDAGVEVVLTDLRRLRDSNLLYSPIWRLLLQWRRRPVGNWIQNPLGDGTIGLSALLELLNFKANHRKVLIVDPPTGALRGLVTSANPHSASARHGNVALEFAGAAAADLLRTEAAVYQFSTGRELPAALRARIEPPEAASGVPAAVSAEGRPLSLRVLTERAIERELHACIARSGAGDRIDLGLFYFADLGLRRALAAALQRGVEVRLLLDPNIDAFGRAKNGIPNQQVGAYLHARGAHVRWYATTGEQFHAKMARFDYQGNRSVLVLGSANWTRRNLRNLNLETNVALEGPADAPVFRDAARYFETVWEGVGADDGFPVPDDVVTSQAFAAYADRSRWRRLLYRIMEQAGAGTF